MSVNPETIHIRSVDNQTVFDITARDAAGHAVVLRTVRVPYSMVKLPDGRLRHVIYDEDCNVRREVYRYLNHKLAGLAPNTVKRAVTALRLFIAFLEINRYDDYRVPEDEYPYFEYFIRLCAPCASSIAGYLSDIRGFLTYLKHDDDVLLRSRMKTVFFPGADGIPRPRVLKEYVNTPSASFAKDRVFPRHNTVADFFNLYNVMRQAGDVAGCLLVILMMVVGRRIGELLNLSVEDVSTYVDEDTGEISDSLYFRQRRNTTMDASAKNRQHVGSVEEYRLREYVEEYMHPFNCRFMDPALVAMLKDYIATAHEAAAADHPDNYAKAVVDVVNPEKYGDEWGTQPNHWLFLNERGGRLTRSAWCKRLVKYYEMAGVSRGFGKSLNHGFRHGNAYVLTHILKMRDVEVADVLGHFNLSSTRVYSQADYRKLAALQTRILQYFLNNEYLENDEREDRQSG